MDHTWAPSPPLNTGPPWGVNAIATLATQATQVQPAKENGGTEAARTQPTHVTHGSATSSSTTAAVGAMTTKTAAAAATTIKAAAATAATAQRRQEQHKELTHVQADEHMRAPLLPGGHARVAIVHPQRDVQGDEGGQDAPEQDEGREPQGDPGLVAPAKHQQPHDVGAQVRQEQDSDFGHGPLSVAGQGLVHLTGPVMGSCKGGGGGTPLTSHSEQPLPTSAYQGCEHCESDRHHRVAKCSTTAINK